MMCSLCSYDDGSIFYYSDRFDAAGEAIKQTFVVVKEAAVASARLMKVFQSG